MWHGTQPFLFISTVLLARRFGHEIFDVISPVKKRLRLILESFAGVCTVTFTLSLWSWKKCNLDRRGFSIPCFSRLVHRWKHSAIRYCRLDSHSSVRIYD